MNFLFFLSDSWKIHFKAHHKNSGLKESSNVKDRVQGLSSNQVSFSSMSNRKSKKRSWGCLLLRYIAPFLVGCSPVLVLRYYLKTYGRLLSYFYSIGLCILVTLIKPTLAILNSLRGRFMKSHDRSHPTSTELDILRKELSQLQYQLDSINERCRKIEKVQKNLEEQAFKNSFHFIKTQSLISILGYSLLRIITQPFWNLFFLFKKTYGLFHVTFYQMVKFPFCLMKSRDFDSSRKLLVDKSSSR